MGSMIGDSVLPLSVATLAGAAVGLERQWSGHAAGPLAHFAGIRTFALLGLLGGIVGRLEVTGSPALAAVLLLGGVGLAVAAYLAASRRDVGGTSEVAALVVLAVGTLAGLGHTRLASALVAVTGLLLVEKTRLHELAARLDGDDLRAGIRFAVMALVVLPLLPAGPLGPGVGVRPRELWALVLFFSGLGFAGHIARRAFGARHGLAVAGAMGGVVSSTNVTLTFARASRDDAAMSHALGVGALAANLVLYPRVLLATALMNPALAWVLLPLLLPPLAVAAGATAWGAWRSASAHGSASAPANPLRVGAALQMAALFQLVQYGADAAQRWWGQAGVVASGAVVGLTDVDALTVTMARGAGVAAGVDAAALAVLVGVLANTILKLALALVLGDSTFRRVAGTGLLGMALATGAMVYGF